jgi:hypothetical protein
MLGHNGEGGYLDDRQERACARLLINAGRFERRK